jgi:hypothetical protein
MDDGGRGIGNGILVACNQSEGKMCQHCGFPNCEEKFHHALTLDFTNLEYGVVHHLLVTTYLLQHNHYTPHAARDIVQIMQILLETIPTEYHKKQVRQCSSGTTRVIRHEPAPPLRDSWALTIESVDFTSSQAYTRTVRAWAAATFTEFLEVQT